MSKRSLRVGCVPWARTRLIQLRLIFLIKTSKPSETLNLSDGLGLNKKCVRTYGHTSYLHTQAALATVWTGEGKNRIDVENPNPGNRAGQIHYQDNAGNKWLYDPKTKTFKDAPKSVNKLLNNPKFKNGIDKAMKYLGEEK